MMTTYKEEQEEAIFRLKIKKHIKEMGMILSPGVRDSNTENLLEIETLLENQNG